jgi:hypothetical protein
MEVQEAFGLKRRHTYDEVVAWLNSDPKGVAYPSRVAFKTYNSPIYGQLKDSLRTFNEAQQGYIAHQRGEDDGAPHVPPRPRPFDNVPVDPPPAPPDDDDDDLMGPPGAGPQRYGDLLEPAPNASDQVLMNEGMNPPNPPPPPPPPAAPTLMQQAGNSFAQAAGGAAGNVVGMAAGQAASSAAQGLMSRAAAAAGVGALAGAEAGPAGVLSGAAIGAVGSMISSAVSGAVSRGFEPGGGSSSQPAGPPTTYGPGGLQVRGQQRNQEAVNRQQRLHNQGSGAPAAQVDFRTLNGQQDSIKPNDRKVKLAKSSPQSANVGILGGQSSGSSGPMVVANTSTRPAPDTMDGGGTKIPRTADPAPAQAPSYNDLVGKLKQTKAPQIGPVTPSRPRSRSPKRGDRRPLDVQREEARNPTGGDVLYPGGDNRKEAMARRGGKMKAPSEAWAKNFKYGFDFTPKKEPERFSIATPPKGTKRAGRNPDIWLYNRKARPNPAAGNQKLIAGKRKATKEPDEPQTDRRPAPEKPGRIGNTKYKGKK